MQFMALKHQHLSASYTLGSTTTAHSWLHRQLTRLAPPPGTWHTTTSLAHTTPQWLTFPFMAFTPSSHHHTHTHTHTHTRHTHTNHDARPPPPPPQSNTMHHHHAPNCHQHTHHTSTLHVHITPPTHTHGNHQHQ